MKKREVFAHSSHVKKRRYVAPVISVELIEMEESIAAGSTVSVGGPCCGQPEIVDQEVDEKNNDLFF
ncbi:hypothetical protein [Sphingobacterium ginsenosidimutans]|uniref:Uncharacterized protein n=1 Tax=Sphingobacterium ginsenosidimutans TaxID=687845 RepID=A0ABP7ZQT4_9SPHI